MNVRLLMIGLDAADCDYIEAHFHRMPNLAQLMTRGTMQRLAVEPLSGAVWPTFFSETRPERHGVYHHVQWDPASMKMRRSHPDWIGEATPFWRKLARNGLKVAAFDVPFVHEGQSGGALEIANWGSHDLVGDFWSTDPAARRVVTSIARRHPMGLEVPVSKSRAKLVPMLEDILRGIDLKTEAALALMQGADWDLFLTVYGETHRGGHIFWPSDDPQTAVPDGAIGSIYERLDAGIGRLIAAAGAETTVMVFALHGMAENRSQSHLSQQMLERVLAGPASNGIEEAPEGKGFGLIRWMRRQVPDSVQHAIAERVPMWVRDHVLARELTGGLDWTETRGFSLDGDVSGYWRLNISGREKKGRLSPDEAQVLRNQIAQAFRGFTNPQGAPIIETVLFPAAEWTGERAFLLPDVVVEWAADMPQLAEARHPTLGRITGRPAKGRTGNHRFTGFVASTRSEELPVISHICELGRVVRATLGVDERIKN